MRALVGTGAIAYRFLISGDPGAVNLDLVEQQVGVPVRLLKKPLLPAELLRVVAKLLSPKSAARGSCTHSWDGSDFLISAQPRAPKLRALMVNPKDVFRSDIEGLRGVAVLSIVAFHAAISGFRGGFTGVNIFFVLSGFLIPTCFAERRACLFERSCNTSDRRIPERRKNDGNDLARPTVHVQNTAQESNLQFDRRARPDTRDCAKCHLQRRGNRALAPTSVQRRFKTGSSVEYVSTSASPGAQFRGRLSRFPQTLADLLRKGGYVDTPRGVNLTERASPEFSPSPASPRLPEHLPPTL
jgi:hypothetical protein